MSRPSRAAALALSLATLSLPAGAEQAAPPPVERAPSMQLVKAVRADDPGTAPSEWTTPSGERRTGRFTFGSYGRVMTAIDGRGRSGRDADLVAHGSRLDEDSYAELELRREDSYQLPSEAHPWTTRMVATLAIGEPLFHRSGKFDATLAVRNLYVEAKGLLSPDLALWAGSRMYRGDDAYLLNWWPLDNLNTVGGGARLDLPRSRTQIALHAGANRLDDPFQLQTARRGLPGNQLGATDVLILDRPRTVESLRVEQIFGLGGRAGVKLVGYSELHQLPSGQRETQPGRYEALPSDSGYVVGAQVTGFTGERDTHVSLFFRHARGLPAYGGDLAVPYALRLDETTKGATDSVAAISGNFEAGAVAVQVAGYLRSFRAATKEKFDYAHLDEGILVVRPHLYFGERAGVFVEASYQAQQRAALRADGGGLMGGSMTRFGVVPFLSPSGRGSYRRPQLRAIFLLSRRSDAARELYATDDVYARRNVEQFFGLEAEWWFNSSYR
ncbi:MAG: carbohydrate porin [Polyangiaceae bacterium]|nr:carbohydrate porin [Polyangiaceae bacterium]